MTIRFLTNDGMPAKDLSKASGRLVETFDPSNKMGRAERARAMVTAGIAVTNSWCPILKQWKCSGTNNPIIILTCQSVGDISQLFLPDLGKENIVRMAAVGIKYVQAPLVQLRQDDFVEVRLCRGPTTTTTQLFHVHYPRPRPVHYSAPAPLWVQRRSAGVPDSEVKTRLLFPRNRRDLAEYLVGANGDLTRVR
ncbi:MAG: hypothetical protein EYC62_08470 [Alphaproteobacteria bacterium]|nr:MAG: hypothetical protein EYC62_08470 [Alphaproteobacteria bacterium]